MNRHTATNQFALAADCSRIDVDVSQDDFFLHKVMEPMDTTVDAFTQSERQILVTRPARSWDL